MFDFSSQRENPEDVVIVREDLAASGVRGLADLEDGSVVGTSSLRRVALLRRAFPNLRFASVRGNLNTRVRKLDGKVAVDNGVEGDTPYSALVLARAGVERLGWESRISEVLDVDVVPYGVGQGALGVECRVEDEELGGLLRKATEDVPSAIRCVAERAFLRGLQGGCQVPIGVQSSWKEGELSLYGIVSSLDGSETVQHETTTSLPHIPDHPPQIHGSASPEQDMKGNVTHKCLPPPYLQAAAQVGKHLAEKLREKGADAILGPIRNPRPLTYGAAEGAK